MSGTWFAEEKGKEELFFSVVKRPTLRKVVINMPSVYMECFLQKFEFSLF